MVSAVSSKIFQPVAGLTLLALAATVFPLTSSAQSPIIKAPSTPAPVTSSRLPVDESYTLGPGDRIQIDVFNVPEYSGENGRQQVLVDGSVNLPLLGKVSVKGMTLSQAANTLTARYRRYLKRPLVTVSLLAARPLNVAIAGEVIRPGSYTMTFTGAGEGSGTQFPTLTRALQMAGGITQSANIREIQVRRPQRSGAAQVVTVNLRDFFQTGDLGRDIALRDGDTIFISTATNISPEDATLLADTTIAADTSQPLNILVTGEVERPGAYTVTNVAKTGVAGEVGEAGGGGGGGADASTSSGSRGGRTTVTRALQTAGGIKPLADIRQIQVKRPTRTGTPQVITVNLLKLLQEGDVKQDITLAQGDTIYVPTTTAPLSPAQVASISASTLSPTSIKVGVIGEAKAPGVVQIPPNTPLTQALLAAGGFDPKRARKSTVQLVRQNPDGTASKREIAVNFAEGANEKTNPTLRNNDVIIVGRSGLAGISDSLGSILGPLGGAFSIFNLFGGD